MFSYLLTDLEIMPRMCCNSSLRHGWKDPLIESGWTTRLVSIGFLSHLQSNHPRYSYNFIANHLNADPSKSKTSFSEKEKKGICIWNNLDDGICAHARTKTQKKKKIKTLQEHKPLNLYWWSYDKRTERKHMIPWFNDDVRSRMGRWMEGQWSKACGECIYTYGKRVGKR